VDLDQEIERLGGRSVRAIFEEEGEERFRDLEALALAKVLSAAAPSVVACGGGVLGRAANREALKARARVVWLLVSPEVAAERLSGPEASGRPLLQGGPVPDRLRSLLDRRGTAYAEAADASVETAGMTPDEVAERIAVALDQPGLRWDSSAS
jgi:shikimate kinase